MDDCIGYIRQCVLVPETVGTLRSGTRRTIAFARRPSVARSKKRPAGRIRTKSVITLLNGKKSELLCVRGNCDAEVDQIVLEFPMMADYAVLDIGIKTIYATHGHIYNKETMPPLKAGNILLYGHMHIPECTKQSGILIMNPGSVSIPKGGSHHGYMMIEQEKAIWKGLDGTVKADYNFL